VASYKNPTTAHEVAHHFGFDEARLEELGGMSGDARERRHEQRM